MIKQASRFLVVSVGGLIVDLAIVRLLLLLTDYHISVAMTVGFFVGALVNYIAHETWTFRDNEAGNKASVKRAAHYYGIVAIALLVRIVTATVLDLFMDSDENSWTIILVAVGLSFCTNFGLTRYMLFRNNATST